MQPNLLKALIRKPAATTLLAALVLVVDYLSGPRIRFPITFVAPVAMAAWQKRRTQASILAALLPMLRLAFYSYGLWHDQADTIKYEAVNMCIQVIMLLLIALLVWKSAVKQQALEKEVRALEDILPVCGFCKKIRDESGNWQPMEVYVTRRSQATFSHTFCPECGQKHYGDILDKT